MASIAWADPGPELPEDTTEERTVPVRAAPESATAVLELPTSAPFFGANRRFLPRVRRSFAASLKLSGARVDGIDLSPSGMLCSSQEIVWPGNVIDFELLLADEPQPIPARGRVVELVSHRGMTAMRVRFEEISARGRGRIAMWMARGRAQRRTRRTG